MSQQGTEDLTGACHEALDKAEIILNPVLALLYQPCWHVPSLAARRSAVDAESQQVGPLAAANGLFAGPDVSLALHGSSSRWGASVALPALMVLGRCRHTWKARCTGRMAIESLL